MHERPDRIPEPNEDENSFSAIHEELEARCDRMSHDLGQFENDLQTLKSRAETDGRKVLIEATRADFAAFAHEVMVAAKRLGVTDEEIANGPADEDGE